MDALRRRPTLAAVLVVLALVLRLLAPALHTCGHEHAPAQGSAHATCAHAACRAHHTEAARALPTRAEVATSETQLAADCVCAVCGVVLLAPAFFPAAAADPRAPPTSERRLDHDETRTLGEPLRLGGSARAPPTPPRTV